MFFNISAFDQPNISTTTLSGTPALKSCEQLKCRKLWGYAGRPEILVNVVAHEFAMDGDLGFDISDGSGKAIPTQSPLLVFALTTNQDMVENHRRSHKQKGVFPSRPRPLVLIFGV